MKLIQTFTLKGHHFLPVKIEVEKKHMFNRNIPSVFGEELPHLKIYQKANHSFLQDGFIYAGISCDS